jgi:hypothetical protein
MSNPYEDSYWNRDTACPEAAEEWSRGYRHAEMRAEEEREEEAARHRAAMRRAEAEAEEWGWMDRQAEADYYAMQQEQYAEEDIRAAEAAQEQERKP